MPIYQYRCKACGHKFERIIRYMKRHNMKCPRCRGQIQKLVSRPGVLITDKSFPYTGTVDKRLDERPVQGRKDWLRRMAAKGLSPMTQREMKEM
jgi:putative FmdB family regulatory protein